jgi:aryl-alcohol dehydrogenase-like predicted oxidoreductase
VGRCEARTAIACIHAALDHGITLFDTANMYGAGEAERVLGEALRSSDKSAISTSIATKVFNPVPPEPDKGLSSAQIVPSNWIALSAPGRGLHRPLPVSSL